jgi:hypothetical protein
VGREEAIRQLRKQKKRHNSSTEGIPYNFMPLPVFYYLREVVPFYTGASSYGVQFMHTEGIEGVPRDIYKTLHA